MITFPRLGKIGRLGNNLFQIASTIGMAKRAGNEAGFPAWEYNKYFKNSFSAYTLKPGTSATLRESFFHYSDHWQALRGINAEVEGYFQSEKYFEHCKDKIKEQFEFDEAFRKKSIRGYEEVFKKRTIAISIRRGDYVDNSNYELLPASYYYLGLMENFPNWRECNLLFFSDDIEYARVHFGCLPNAYFAGDFVEGKYFEANETAISQLCLMTYCDDFIIANSTFSWWGAWLGEKKGSKVVRPAHYFAGKLLKKCDLKDHYPERWVAFDHKGKKLDLRDVTFTIPVAYDHKDRKQNLDLCVCLLQRDFDTNIVVGEQGTRQFGYFSQWCEYREFNEPFFHRTKMLNDMARDADTPIVVNYDCDVFHPPLQIWMAAEMLRTGEADMVYPYDGRFARVPREQWFKEIEKRLDVGFFRNTAFRGTGNADRLSVGGAVLVNKDKFFESGGENEEYVSYAPEDASRYYRWNKLGYNVKRVKGILYHMDHWCGPDSSMKHVHAEKNRKLWRRIKSMSKKELKEYIETWSWAQK